MRGTNVTRWRYSIVYRIVAFLLIFDFVLFQNLAFAETQIQFQQDTGNYQPVKPADQPLESEEKGTGSEILPSTTTASLPVPFSEDHLPNPADFWNESPLSAPTTESLRGGLQADEAISEIASALPGLLPRNDAGHEFDIYSFEDALDLIRPEFAAAIPMRNQFELI